MKLKFPAKMPVLKFKALPRWGIIAIIVLGILGLLFLSRSLFIAALVNGRPVSRLAVIKELEKQSGQVALDSLVSRALILQEAKKAKVSAASSDIEKESQRIEELLKNQGTTLTDALAAQGMTQADFEEQIKIQIILEKLLADKTAVSEADIEKYFTDNKNAFEKGAKLEDVKVQIGETLHQQKLGEAYLAWISDLKAKAKINYFVAY